MSEKTPVFKDIYVKNLVSRNARRALFFGGLPEMNIENINLENAYITASYGAEFSESKDVTFKNVTVVANEGAAFIFNNVTNFKATDLAYEVNESSKVASVSGSRNSNIELSNIDEDEVDLASEVNKEEVIFK